MWREIAMTALAQTAKFVYRNPMKYVKWGLLSLAFSQIAFSESARRTASDANATNAQAAKSPEQVKKRLNQILYWQLADELRLSPKSEKEMVAVIEDIQSRRERALIERAGAMQEFKQKPASSEAHLRLTKAYKELSILDMQEHQRLEKILGLESLGRFYVIREKVAEKISHSLRETASK